LRLDLGICFYTAWADCRIPPAIFRRRLRVVFCRLTKFHERPVCAVFAEKLDKFGELFYCGKPLHSMRIFKPEYRFESLDSHSLIYEPIFWRTHIVIEFIEPLLGTRRRPHTSRMPVQHRQTGTGEPGHPAKNYHYENQAQGKQQPTHYRAVMFAGL
jgi:hypothetical protein